LKVSANVKISMQGFEIFRGSNAQNAPPPGCAPARSTSLSNVLQQSISLVNYIKGSASS